MGEHLPCKQGVKGSIPFISTRDAKASRGREGGPKRDSFLKPNYEMGS